MGGGLGKHDKGEWIEKATHSGLYLFVQLFVVESPNMHAETYTSYGLRKLLG